MAELSSVSRAASNLSSLGSCRPIPVKSSSLSAASHRPPSVAPVRASADGDLSVNIFPRRAVLALPAMAAIVSYAIAADPAHAVIPTTAVAGRVPGLTEPDENGLRTYKRPASKSGGHGVGWSELIPYTFKVPETWEETPVSIADLGGTEIDLRFQSKQQGKLFIVVAPVLRFSDGLGDDVRIESIGSAERVISAFGPEITGESVEGRVKETTVVQVDGRTYYRYDIDPHILVSATAAGNRLYIMGVSASGRQWKKYSSSLQDILTSFRV